MSTCRMLAVALIGLSAAGALANELVGVEGSSVQYPTPIASKIAGKDVRLVLTGTAERTKTFLISVNVYAIGSYIQEGVKVHSAEELAAANCCKQLHLVMERDIDGKDMAEAFHNAVRLNYDAPQFDHELSVLMEYMRAHPVKKGDHVWLTSVPGAGLHCNQVGKGDIKIDNPAFARAVWEIYLGKNNLGESIKKGLTSRL
jgi:hypothetical protein